MIRKIMAAALCISLFCSAGITAAAAENQAGGTGNVPSSWAVEYIDKGVEMDICDRNGADLNYQRYIDRDTYCSLVYRTLEKSGKISADLTDGSEPVFFDTDRMEITALNKIGIIKGKGNNRFCPKDSLTREEAAVILWRMIQFTGCEEDQPDQPAALYSDDAAISSWARDAVYKLLSYKIMQGTGSGFEPIGSYTGEQAVTTMVRMTELMRKHSAEVTDSDAFVDNMNALMPKDKNYTFSPLSIKMALAMAANGASDDTQKEILEAVGIKDLDSFNKETEAMIAKYGQSDFLTLSVANSIWINTSNTNSRFSGMFSELVKKYYNADSDTVTRNNACGKINGWANEKTNGKIPSIIGKNDLNFESLLLNAVYFRGTWAKEFYPESTAKDLFTDRNGKKSSIDFMNQRDWMRYADVDGVQMISLPYMTMREKLDEDGNLIGFDTLKNTNISMYLMTSDNAFNPNQVLNKASFQSRFVKLSMPKFKIEYSENLNDSLQQLGIKTAFTQKADFREMFDSGNMQISDVIHKTYISVDEKGTEAAAVTAITEASTALPEQPIELKFNKPFTFAIRDNISGEILFLGEYAFAG